jgi:hypothetical protein
MRRIKTMRYITMLGLALLAASAIAGAGAISVSASGDEFYASKSGKVVAKSTNEQIFKTAAGTIECESASGTGEVTAGSTTTNKEVVTYSGCTGLDTGITITAVHFEFKASGLTKIEKSVTVTPEGAGCQVIIPAQTVESVTYTNASGKVTAAASISKIHSHGTGGFCGSEEETGGSYSGSLKSEYESGTGTLEWKS